MSALLITSLVLLIMASAFFSGSETVLFSLSSMKVKGFRKEARPSRRLVAHLLASPKDLLVTIILVNVVVNILIQNVVSTLFEKESSWMLSVGVPLILVLLFGEFIPKSIAMANNTRLAPIVAPVVYGASVLLKPFRRLFTTLTQVVSRFMFFFLKREKEISVEELEHTLEDSRKTGILNDLEEEIVQGYLELEGSSIKEYLRPREEVLFFEKTESLERLIHLFVDEECSRIPVCEGDFDHILGIITAQAFFLYRSKIHTAADLIPLLEKPFFVPESLCPKNLMAQMHAKENSLAIVVDEYGATSGLITFEDLVEVIVGEIVDRRDETSRYTQSSEDAIIASGKLELTEFEEIFGIELQSPNNMVTLGGWLTEQLGDIPKSGVKYSTREFLFHVLTSDETRVKRVYVRRLKRGAHG